MDLTLDIENYKLNIRAAAVIIHNNKILVHRDIRKDHCTLTGGRIAIGESSKETVKREIKEEIGKEYLRYEWLDVNKIEEYNIVPKCLKEVLKSQDFPIHIIHKD